MVTRLVWLWMGMSSQALAWDRVVLDAPVLVGAELAPVVDVEAADMDLDGDLDLVACGPNGTGWYLQSATGWSFVAGPTAACVSLEVGDVDRDGRVDVVTLEPGIGPVVHYLDGIDTWTRAVVDPTNAYAADALEFGLADVSRDHNLDVFTYGGPYLVRYLHLGGRQGFQVTRFNNDFTPTAVQLADVEGDGDPDFAVFDGATGAFHVMWNAGWGPDRVRESWSNLQGGGTGFLLRDLARDGTPEALFWGNAAGIVQYRTRDDSTYYACCANESPPVVADFDLDGQLEYVATRGGRLRVTNSREGSGNEPYGLRQTLGPFAAVGTPEGIAADLDRDGDQDLVWADEAGVHVSNNRIPHVSAERWLDYTVPGSWGSPSMVLTGQVDGLYFDDLVVAGRNGDGLSVMRSGTGGLNAWTSSTITARTVGGLGQLADIDVDGTQDVVAVDDAGHLYAWANQGEADVWVEHDLGLDGLSALLVEDVDGDGFPDLAVGSGGPAGEVVLHSRVNVDPGQWFFPFDPYTLHTAPGATIRGVDVGDVDQDGDMDLLVWEDDGGTTVRWLENDGQVAVAWTAHDVFSSPSPSTRIAFLDADRDGWLDVLSDEEGVLTVRTAIGAPLAGPWSVLASAPASSLWTTTPRDIDMDGVEEVFTWDGSSVWAQGFDWRTGAFEPPVLIWEDVAEPGAMTAFSGWDYNGFLEPLLATLGDEAAVRFFQTKAGDVASVATGPVPADGAHLSYIQSGVVAVPTVDYGARMGDAPLGPRVVELRGTLGGNQASGTTLADLGVWRLWVDADGDAVFDVNVDAAIPVEVLPDDNTLALHPDLEADDAGIAPGTEGAWFVELVPHEATTLGPAQDLEIQLAGVTLGTVPLGIRVKQSESVGWTGSWVVGNTAPGFGPQHVVVQEGGDVVFDPLALVEDADDDPVSVVRLVGQPAHGVAVFEEGLIHYTHDGSEDPEDVLVVEISDGLVTVSRIVLIDVTAVDDPPWALGGVVEGLEDQELEIVLSGGDPDDAPVFELTVLPASGQAALSGAILTYTPASNYVGTDAFTFVVRGGAITSAPATVTIEVVEDLTDDDDGDGLADADDLCPDTPDLTNADLDGDGLGDVCDDDDDDDGIVDTADPCPTLPRPEDTGADDPCFDDDDFDGVPDSVDLCPRRADPDQDDADQDGLGDACDPDDDDDRVMDGDDNCPLNSNHAQRDADGDGMGDACDDDDDDDGVVDSQDVCPWTADPRQLDLDEDGVGDACDGDADGDGTPTALDCDDRDPAVQVPQTFFEDGDGDGWGTAGASVDACASVPPAGLAWDGSDNCPATANPDQADLDRDGTGDACDDTNDLPDPEPVGCRQGGLANLGWVLLLPLLIRRRSAQEQPG